MPHTQYITVTVTQDLEHVAPVLFDSAISKGTAAWIGDILICPLFASSAPNHAAAPNEMHAQRGTAFLGIGALSTLATPSESPE